MSKGKESAFPTSKVQEYRSGYAFDGREQFAEEVVKSGGLTKREMFAMAAMQGMLAGGMGIYDAYRASGENEAGVVVALRIADALLKELAKEKE